MRKAIFLDRDGVINKRLVGGYVKTPEEFELLPKVKEALKELKKKGYLIIIVSNQQGVGKGLMTEEDLENVNKYMLKLLPEIDDVFYCTELEEDDPWCRKPRPGMLIEAIIKWRIDPYNSWMIGDSESDMIAGKAIGCKTIQITRDKKSPTYADYVSDDLWGVISIIEKNGDVSKGVPNRLLIYTYVLLKRLDDIIATVYFYLYKLTHPNKDLELVEKLKNAKEIYFDRSDLIGDAIVTIPLFFALKRMGLKFTILTSKYNDWVLNPFFKTRVVANYPERTPLRKALIDTLKEIINSKFRPKKKKDCILFLLKQSTSAKLLRKFSQCYIVNCIGKFLDYIYADYNCNSKLFNERHQLVESYLTPFNKLGINNLIEEYPSELNQYVNQVASKSAKDITKKAGNDYIVMFIGNKLYRRLPPAIWAKWIRELKDHPGKIIVIDDSGESISILKKLVYKEQLKKIIWINKLESLWDGMYIATRAKWVIGVDGGGFNFLQMPTNAIEIILYVNPYRWRPFSKNRCQELYKTNRYTVYLTRTSKGRYKLVCAPRDKKRFAYEAYKVPNPKSMWEIYELNMDVVISITKKSKRRKIFNGVPLENY